MLGDLSDPGQADAEGCLKRDAAYAEGPDIGAGICFNIAARHYDELRAKYRAGRCRTS